MLVATKPSVPPLQFVLNRRAFIRRRPRGCIKVECRKGVLGVGPNLAEGLLDLSTHGAGLVLVGDQIKGQELEVCLIAPYGRPLKVMAHVVWTQPLPNGRWRAGVRFAKPLSYAEFVRLT